MFAKTFSVMFSETITVMFAQTFSLVFSETLAVVFAEISVMFCDLSKNFCRKSLRFFVLEMFAVTLLGHRTKKVVGKGKKKKMCYAQPSHKLSCNTIATQ